VTTIAPHHRHVTRKDDGPDLDPLDAKEYLLLEPPRIEKYVGRRRGLMKRKMGKEDCRRRTIWFGADGYGWYP
jgi:hypothetical protein